MSGAAGQLRALVVDDEEELARLIADYLHKDGFTAQVALDRERALELARAASPDVVVLDLMLPGMDGVEVCRRLRTFSDAYVIMLTARAEEVDKLNAMLRRPRGQPAGDSERPARARAWAPGSPSRCRPQTTGQPDSSRTPVSTRSQPAATC